MPGACCKGRGKRKHTPIVSGKERGLFGAAYGAKKSGKGKPSYVPKSLFNQPMSTLKMHLKEYGGKKGKRGNRGKKK